MNNIIEYVAPASDAHFIVLTVFFALLAAVFWAQGFILLGKNKERHAWGHLLCALSLLLVISIPFLALQWSDARRSGLNKMQAQTTELYPSITEEQAKALWRYVSTDRPEGDFAVIRTMSLPPEGDAAGFTRREVSLVWNGKGYVLAQSVDGEKFEPLER